MSKRLLITLAAFACVTAAANAGTPFSVGVGFGAPYYGGYAYYGRGHHGHYAVGLGYAPRYYSPPPAVYVAPRPVYVVPAPGYYVQPAPGYYYFAPTGDYDPPQGTPKQGAPAQAAYPPPPPAQAAPPAVPPPPPPGTRSF